MTTNALSLSAISRSGDIEDPIEVCEKKLIQWQKWVELESWAASRPSLYAERRFPQARNEMLQIACSISDLTQRSQAFEILHRLFALDPLSEHTSSSLLQTIQELSEQFEPKKITNFSDSQKQTLVEVYSVAVECAISHLGQKLIGKVPEEVQVGFIRAPDRLKKLSSASHEETELHSTYATEGAKRLKSDRDVGNFLPTAISLIKFAVAIGTKNIGGALNAVHELYEQYAKEREFNIRAWYEDGYIFRHLGRNAVRSRDPVSIIDGIARLILEKSGKKLGIWRRILHPTLLIDCDWQVFLSAAYAYKHIVLYYAGKEQIVYRKALKFSRKKPGLLGILPLAKRAIKYVKVENGITQMIEDLIKQDVVSRFFDAKTKNKFYEDLAKLFEILEFPESKKRVEALLSEWATSQEPEFHTDIGSDRPLADLEAVQRGIAEGAEPFAHQDENGKRALDLISLPSVTELTNNQGEKPFEERFYRAVLEGKQEEVVFFVEQRASPTAYRDEEGNTALHLAAKRADSQIFLELLRLVPPASLTELKNNREETPMSLAMKSSFAHIKAINQVYPDVLLEGVGVHTRFYQAVREGKKEEVAFFLDHGQNPSGVVEGKTFSITAIDHDQFEIADLLFQAGASLEGAEINPYFEHEKVEQLRYLLKKGIKARELKDGTLFRKAMDEGRLNIAQLLLEEDADINQVPPGKDCNALHQAISEEDQQKIRFLLVRGASTNAFEDARISKEELETINLEIFSQPFLEDLFQGNIDRFLKLRHHLLEIVFPGFTKADSSPLQRLLGSEIALDPVVLRSLLYLFKIDPINGRTFEGLKEVFKQFSSRLQGRGEKELFSFYAASIEHFLSHLQKGNLKTTPYFLQPVCDQDQMCIEGVYINEWISRITTDPQKELIERLRCLSAFAQDRDALVDQKVEATLTWYEAGYVMSQMGDLIVVSPYPDRSSILHKLKGFVLREIRKTRSLPEYMVENVSKYLLVKAANVYAQILLYYDPQRADAQDIYRDTLRTQSESPGIMGLLSVSEREDKALEAEIGDIISSLIDDRYHSSTFTVETKKDFEEGLLFTFGSIDCENTARKLFHKLEKNPLIFNRMKELWKEKKNKWLDLVNNQIEKLSTLQQTKELDEEEKTALNEMLGSLEERKWREASESFTEAVETISTEESFGRERDPYDLFGNLMTDPVTTPSGNLYDRKAISSWIAAVGTDPMTGEPLQRKDLKENAFLKMQFSQDSSQLSLFRSFKPEMHHVHKELIKAVVSENLDETKMRESIRKGAYPAHDIDCEGNTALHLVAEKTNARVFRELLLLVNKESLLSVLDYKNWAQQTVLSIVKGKQEMEAVIWEIFSFHTETRGRRLEIASLEKEISLLDIELADLEGKIKVKEAVGAMDVLLLQKKNTSGEKKWFRAQSKEEGQREIDTRKLEIGEEIKSFQDSYRKALEKKKELNKKLEEVKTEAQASLPVHRVIQL